MKRLALALPVVLIAACGKKPEAPAPQPLPVTVAAPVKRDVTVHRDFPSTLAGAQEIEIRARVQGTLSLHPDAPEFAGQKVEKGTPLFEIEPDTYQQATLEAKAMLARAEAARVLAGQRFERISNAREGSVSALDRDIAKAEFDEARAAESEAKARVEKAKINESYTIITAPVTGRMSRLLVDPGNLVGTGGSTLLATIIDDSTMLAYFEVPERAAIKYFEKRDNGEAQQVYEKPIRLKLADGSIYPTPGRIDYIENQVDTATRTAKVRAVFPNPEGALSSGLYGLVGYPTGPIPGDPTATEALLVPSVAVLRDLGGNYVWIVDDQNIVRRRVVETGDSVEKPVTDPNAPRSLETVILKGLDGSERVIVSGLQRAREGAPVTPVPAEQAPKAEQ